MIKKVIPLKLALERDLICLKTTFILKCGITSCLRDFMTHRFFGCPSTGPTLPSSDPRQTSWGLDANLKLNLFTEARFPDTLTRQIRVNWEQICFHICRKFSVESKIGFTFQDKFYFPKRSIWVEAVEPACGPSSVDAEGLVCRPEEERLNLNQRRHFTFSHPQ